MLTMRLLRVNIYEVLCGNAELKPKTAGVLLQNIMIIIRLPRKS